MRPRHTLGIAALLVTVATNFGIGAHKRRNRSIVGRWLPLRQDSRPKPDHHRWRFVHHGEGGGGYWFDCGASAGFLSALAHRDGGRALTDERAGVLAPLPPRGAKRGTGRPRGHDTNGRQSGSASARRDGSRSRIASVRPGNSCPATAYYSAGERSGTKAAQHDPTPARRTQSSRTTRQATARCQIFNAQRRLLHVEHG